MFLKSLIGKKLNTVLRNAHMTLISCFQSSQWRFGGFYSAYGRKALIE
jgi:hypothetical protein